MNKCKDIPNVVGTLYIVSNEHYIKLSKDQKSKYSEIEVEGVIYYAIGDKPLPVNK